ncbi:MAG: lysozyme [Halothiobacillus sp.]
MKNRFPIAVLLLSGASLVGIALNEGYQSQAYDDGGGVQTIGFGTTIHADGSSVKSGEQTTPTRALVELGQHVSKTENQMRTCIGEVPLYQYEWDAYVSLAYNIGTGAFCGSTLVKKLKQMPPDYVQACIQIKRWNKDNGRVVQGLVKRRAAEYTQCVGGDLSSTSASADLTPVQDFGTASGLKPLLQEIRHER